MQKVEIFARRPTCADSEPFVETADTVPPVSVDGHVGPCPHHPRKLAPSILGRIL
jgi:hypothetical protein